MKQNLLTYKEYFTKQKYLDDFGWSSEWNSEVRKWLRYVHEIAPDFLQKSKNRIIKEKQRDELLAEFKSLYFTGTKLGLKITEIEPLGKNNYHLDFSFKDQSGKEWMVEVKSPSWRGEVWKDSSLTQEEKKERLLKPQFVNAEVKSFSIDDAIIEPIKNSVNKFKPQTNNLLLISPNMFTTPLVHPYLNQRVKNLVENYDKERVISSLCILQVTLPVNADFRYDYKFIQIKELPKIPPRPPKI